MGASYVFLLTAFYVDNGKNLPLWKELPQIAFWFLPSAIGVPLTGERLALYFPPGDGTQRRSRREGPMRTARVSADEHCGATSQ